MKENNFSFKKRLNSSRLSSVSQHSINSNNSLNSINLNEPNTKFRKTKRLKYFEIYNQVIEEIKKNNKDKKKQNKNYSDLEIQGTKDLEGLYKKNLSSQVKNNQKNFKVNMPLNSLNPKLNKNFSKVNCTPIPYMQNNNLINNLELKEFDKTIQKAIFIRKMEYTHDKPQSKSFGDIELSKNNEKCFGYYYINIIKAVKLIQKWYRFIRKNRINSNKPKLKNKNKYINILNDENCNYNNDNIIEKNLNNFIDKNENNKNNNILQNFSNEIKKQNDPKNLNEIDSELKPINNNCYISKGNLILLNNCPDMNNLILIQKNVKNFLKNKNNISPYKIYKLLIENKINKKNSINKELNSSIENILGDFSNNSENIFCKRRIISKLDSLQSIHNLTIQENEKKISNNFFKEREDNNESNSFSENHIIYDNDNNNRNNDSNLLNFSFNSEKNKFKNQNEKEKIIKIKKNFNKEYYISKIIYYNNTELIVKLKDLQNNIKNFLQKNNKNKNNIYTENSSEIDEKNNDNNYLIENVYFEMHPKEKNNKTKILKILLNKYNKKLNKEVDDNINLYYNKNDEKNKIMKITKKKLVITLKKILNVHLKGIFNDIYQYENIYYRREKILLKIFNNILSKLKRYFYRWSNRPLKLLIYKSKSVKYYNSLITINNNIKKLIHSIYTIFISKYFYLLIINYLYTNNIDITNIKIFSALKNKKKLKLCIEISKNINQNNNQNDSNKNLNIVEFFKTLENSSNSLNDEEIEENDFSDI